jgi:hypothetical protein
VPASDSGVGTGVVCAEDAAEHVGVRRDAVEFDTERAAASLVRIPWEIAEEDSESDANVGAPGVVAGADCGHGPACPVEPHSPSSAEGNEEGTKAMTVGDEAEDTKGGKE